MTPAQRQILATLLVGDHVGRCRRMNKMLSYRRETALQGAL